MAIGILYVIFNKWISNPETNEIPYKIGITKKSVDERYYGLGLKMPGKFEVLFAYRIENYERVEKIIHDTLYLYCENGEWFNIDERKLAWIKETCEYMGGIDITDEINNEIEIQTEINQDDIENSQLMDTEHTGQLIIKKLNEYEYIKIISKNKRCTWINISTEKMNKLLPPNNDGKGGSWNDGTKYHYWFDINDDNTYFCLELGPNGQDENVIKKMNQITTMYNKNNVSSTVGRYRRIFKKSLNIGLIKNNDEEMINSEIDLLIIELLKEEENIIKGIK
jgi:hypothetical protein